jgi:hypothetical protein
MIRRRPYAVRAATTLEADDFTLIKGIGPTIAARLRDIGIMTFAQLADLTPDEIAIRVVGLSAKRIAREKWIKQARKHASKKVAVEAHEGRVDREIGQHYATFTVELLLNKDNSVRRTRVTYVQNKTEEAWPGWEELRLVNFIVRCADLPIPSPEPSPLLEAVPPLPNTVPPPMVTSSLPATDRFPNTSVTSNLSGVLEVYDLVATPLGSDVPQNAVRVGEVFNVRLVCDLTKVRRLPSFPLESVVTIWAKKLGTGDRQIVGETRSVFMPADKVTCMAEVSIPCEGIYRLEGLVALTEQGQESLPQRKLMAMQTSNPLQVY